MPRDSIKSICNEYVFNTVFTRPKSLVCVAGNPFLLMHMGSGFKTNCWIEYVRKCLQCESLLLNLSQNDEQSLPETYELLFKKVGIMNSLTEAAEEDFDDVDVIIERYIEDLQKRKDYKIAKSLVQEPTGEFKWIDEEDTGQPTCTDSRNVVWCKLSCNNFREVTATPINRPGQQVHLKGVSNRRCGFHGDVVRINLSERRVLLDDQTEKAILNTHFGEAFICRVDPTNSILFHPLDYRYPNFVNLPMLTKDQKATNDVVCFDPKSINSVPKVNDFIPMKCAVKMVFVVKFLGWKKESYFPLGMIVGALPSGQSPFVADLILRITNNVPPAKYPEFAGKIDQSDVKGTTRPALLFEDAFTIDPKGATDHDDALTCRRISQDVGGKVQTFQIGIHITDIQKFIPKGSELDRLAFQRGSSFYRSSDNCISHMLPNDLMINSMSFTVGSQRSSQSVVTNFTLKDGCVKSIGKVRFLESQVTCELNLTYMEAESYLCPELTLFHPDHSLHSRGKCFNAKFSKGQPIGNQIQILWKVAMFLRKKRLGNAGASGYEVKTSKELCPEAHHLVEELMIWANSKVAERISKTFPQCSIVRVQPEPSSDHLEKLVQSSGSTMASSLRLRRYVSAPEKYNHNILMLKSMGDLIERLLKDGLVRYALHQIQFEHHHPLTSITSRKLQKNSSPSTYKRSDIQPNVNWHDSLQCEQYTHFTSPIRRYGDIVIQRLLHAVLNGHRCPYSIQEVDDICQSLNSSQKCSNAYDRDVCRLDLALSLKESSQQFEASIVDNNMERASLEIHFLDHKLRVLSPEERKLPLESLKPIAIPTNCRTCLVYSPPSKFTNQIELFTWKAKVVSFVGGPNQFLSHPRLKVDSTRNQATSFSERSGTVNVFYPDNVTAAQQSALSQKSINVYFDPLTYLIPKPVWDSLLDVLSLEPTDIQEKYLERLLALTPSSLQHTSQNPNPREPSLILNKCSLWIYTVKRVVREGEVFNVQLSASSRNQHGLYSPCVQLFEVAPELRVCVQHNTNPAKCFTEKIFENASRQRYNSIGDYFQRWEQVLLAEAAVTSVSENEVLLVKDVDLQWPQLDKTIDSGGRVAYRLPIVDGEENMGVRMDLPRDFVTMSLDLFPFYTGDLACVRYDVCQENGAEECRSVFHMIVHHVNKEFIEDILVSVTVFLKFVSKTTNSVCSKMAPILAKSFSPRKVGFNVKCEVQLIPLSLPFRYIYISLSKPFR